MRKITVNVNDVKGKLDRYFSQCIGAGRAGEVMRRVPAKQLERIQRECPFSYIRFHGLFYEEMDIVSRKSDGTLRFHFQYVDHLFDQLLENNIRPVAELGLMPEILAWNIVQPQIETSNQDYFNQSLPAKQLTDAEITVSNMEPGKTYRIDCETIGYRKGDLYQAYLDGGYGEIPNREEIAVLMEKAKPEKTCLEATADGNGVLRFAIPQTENQVDFLSIQLA